MHDERPPQPVPRPWRRLFARAIQTVHGTHRPFHGCAFSASLSALASVLLPTNLHRGRETAPRSTAQLESAASRALSHSAFQKSSQFANTHQSASPYGVASAEICAARVLTNDLSPVMSLICEYAPDLEAERGERITAAAVYNSSAISFLHRMLYRSEYDAPLNSGNKGMFGDTSVTRLREAGASSRSIKLFYDGNRSWEASIIFSRYPCQQCAIFHAGLLIIKPLKWVGLYVRSFELQKLELIKCWSCFL